MQFLRAAIESVLRKRTSPLSKGLGVEIYLLAGLVAFAPLAVFALVLDSQIERFVTGRSEATLFETARLYGQQVRERLTAADEALSLVTGNAVAGEVSLPDALAAYTLVDPTGSTIAAAGSLPDSVVAAAAATTAARLIVGSTSGGPQLFLARNTGAGTAIAELRAGYLWRRMDLAAPVRLCAIASGADQPLSCLGHITNEALGTVGDGSQTGGTFRWQSDGEDFVGSYVAFPDLPQIEMPPIRIVASLTFADALAVLTPFRELYRFTFVAVALLGLLGSMLYSRRILNPLAKMLDVTKQLTRRDIWGRADVRLQENYSNLANHLQYMADDLAQQFNARETLSRIDQVILSGADTALIVDLILRHIVESVKCRRAVVTILADEDDRNAITATMSRGHPVARRAQIEVTPEQRKWLGDQAGGILLSNPLRDGLYDPFVAWDTPHTYVLPISADNQTAAAVSIMTLDGSGLDDNQQGHVRDLAGRLAVALEAVSRSDRLRRKAFFDDLTGLPNRDFCFTRLDRAIRQAQQLDGAVAVMFIDLDGFKGINDSLGHIAGDELIRQAAYRLSNCISESGTVGRLGGDEFAIVLPFPVNSQDPSHLANRVLAAISEPFKIGTSEIHLSASIGIARYPEDGEVRSDLLRKADTAMYRAKENGRGRSVDYSDTMGIKVDQRLRLESDLRNALDNDELLVYYQPQIDMRSGRIVSAEALVRWDHPERGLISPAEFIPIAEESGYIHVLGSWVMSNACRQLARWRAAGVDLRRVSVNVSARQFRHHDFIGTVESCLLELLSSSESLEIELTESLFVDDLTKARQTLERLKATGVYVSIDDFGTGYSSLGYLKHLTFDAVKVDQSFIQELPDERKSEAIVQAVLAMCHTLGKDVVAEGIETESQFHYLRKAGVDIGQGFLIGKPMHADNFTSFVTRMNRSAEKRAAARSA